ncbi:MAG TPA: 5-formyltetrahydrofolate cyclo-ligase [Micromonosporaceae bacterium]
MTTAQDAGTGVGKPVLRAELLAARRAIPSQRRLPADQRLVRELVVALRQVRTVAGFLPFGTEPCATATPSLPDALLAVGVQVLLPVLLPDLDLDWAGYDGRLAPAARGLKEPVGPRLGPAAIASVDAVVVPAVAVDRAGVRLGRGGGSYDRALARVPAGVPVIAPLYEAEWVARLPADPHDQRVTAVVTPGRGMVRLPA